ncbi:MAG: phosphoenolpyruvate--protein phosphotransferase [Elusimicrobiaceae bacterium]|nr:phosphoenolpyruvate--protein phosphotransferase [Elusimicrobiaceae bacterium]
MPNFQVLSTTDGNLVPLEQVPDPAFSERMLGDGIAIEPTAGFTVAPFDGKVVSVHKALHAVVVEREGLQVLIHVGVETVNLKGQGFRALVEAGQTVKAGDKLTEFDLNFITQNAPSNLIIMIVTSPDGASVVPAAAGPVQAGKSFVFSVPGIDGENAPVQPQTTEWISSRSVTIFNPNGLHARPAGKLASLAKAHSFPIEIVKENNTADVKSLVSIMGLSIDRGSQVFLRAPASAPQAAEVLEKLITEIENGLGEDIHGQTAETKAEDENETGALTACDGIAFGKACQFSDSQFSFEETADNAQQEQTRFAQVLQAVKQEIEAEINKATSCTKEILRAHQELLQDPFLLSQTQEGIQSGKSAPAALNEAIRASIDVLKKTKNRFLMERISDFKDVRKRLLAQLCGPGKACTITQDCILIATDLLPSDLSLFQGKVKGVILSEGSPTAHVSILLRNMGIASIVSAGENVLDITDGTEIILHASKAIFYTDPSQEVREEMSKLLQIQQQQQEQNQKLAHQSAKTQDGVEIFVEGNAGKQEEAQDCAANGADGLGLVRTEFLFFQRNTPPTLEEQQATYQGILQSMNGKPATLRTLDVGGDKPVSYMPLPEEENPIVGLRGVRNYQQYRELFSQQIRAMLKVSCPQHLRIMLPMVAFVEEFLEYKKLIEQEKEALGIQAPVQIGVMIEVPSAALLAEQLAQHADFFSIGTNDLTQYTLAIDRGHKTLCAQADPLHPAVLRLIELTCQGAQKHGKPVAVCGAIAGDMQAVPLLIGLGVKELAVGAACIASIKARVRSLQHKDCVLAAKQALNLQSSAQVRALVKQTFAVN